MRTVSIVITKPFLHTTLT